MANELMVSAQFAAFLWLIGNTERSGEDSAAALRFARDNWEFFLPLAHKGLGRLLLKMARPRHRRRRVSTRGMAAPLSLN